MVSAAPPVRYPCPYGIDMSTRDEIIAARQSPDAVRRLIGADGLVYQPLESLQALYRDVGCCDACFSGEYPTGLDAEALTRIEREKDRSGRAG